MASHRRGNNRVHRTEGEEHVSHLYRPVIDGLSIARANLIASKAKQTDGFWVAFVTEQQAHDLAVDLHKRTKDGFVPPECFVPSAALVKIIGDAKVAALLWGDLVVATLKRTP